MQVTLPQREAQGDELRAGEEECGPSPPAPTASESSYDPRVFDLRACADRSWLSRRSAFPTVAAPCFPDQSPDDDDHLREGHPEVDHPPHPLRTPEELLVGVVP